jgi:hypothetical protein
MPRRLRIEIEATVGGAACLARIATSSRRSAFERTSKRRRGFPSDTNVKRGDRVVHGDKELLPPRSSVGRTPAHAAQDGASATAAATRGAFDGNLDYFAR